MFLVRFPWFFLCVSSGEVLPYCLQVTPCELVIWVACCNVIICFGGGGGGKVGRNVYF